MSAPPDGLPVYRVLTGPDDAKFCRRVSEMIALGYRLHEGPAVTFAGERVIVEGIQKARPGSTVNATERPVTSETGTAGKGA